MSDRKTTPRTVEDDIVSWRDYLKRQQQVKADAEYRIQVAETSITRLQQLIDNASHVKSR